VDSLLVSRDGPIATVTLNNPERLNALHKSMWLALRDTMRELGRDESLRCVVLRGAGKTAKLPRSYWSWEEMLGPNKSGFFPYTPATNLLYGLREALKMLEEEGLENVLKRHDRHAEAARRAVRAWGLEILCLNPTEYSSALTAVLMPDGHNEVEFRKVVLERYNMSLGSGLGKIANKVFRIGHLGDFNDLTLLGTLCGVEMGLAVAGIPHQKGGVDAAMQYLSGAVRSEKKSVKAA